MNRANSSEDRSDGLVRHGLWLFAATQVANVCNIFFQVVMGRNLPPGEYSALVTLLNVMLALGTPLEALRTSAAHFAAKASTSETLGTLKPVVVCWVKKLVRAGATITLAACLGSPWIAAYFHLANVWPVIITGFTTTGIILLPLLAGTLQGLQAFGWMAATIQGLSVARFLLGWLLVLTWTTTSLSGLSAQFGGVMLSVTVASLGLWTLLPRGGAHSGKDAIGSYFFKALMMLGGYAVLMNIDVVLARHYFVEGSQSFAQAAMVSRSIIFLPMPIAQAMFPKVVGSSSGVSTFLKALGIAFIIVAFGALICLLFPQWPLMLLFKTATPESVRLLRLIVLAMAPLSLTYLLMNFAMARQRFQAGIPLLLSAVLYAGGVMLWHTRVENIIIMLAIGCTTSLLGFLATRPWRG